MLDWNQISTDMKETVRWALAEDIGSGDITALLIPEQRQAKAVIVCKEDGVLSGQEWVNETYRQLSPSVTLQWNFKEGASIKKGDVIVSLQGPARALLTGERTGLNFLQTLSGVATRCRAIANLVAHTRVKVLDTRKTLPGLRTALKYAVTCGGCHNHRIGLYDAFLIKENHISACGSISAAIKTANQVAPGKPVEVEVENFAELEEALNAGADIVMLDDFTLEDTEKAVKFTAGRAKLETSGGINEANIAQYAETGIDFISLGTLTKDVKAIDLSFRVLDE